MTKSDTLKIKSANQNQIENLIMYLTPKTHVTNSRSFTYPSVRFSEGESGEGKKENLITVVHDNCSGIYAIFFI